MIIGNGDIASSLIDTNKLLFFASGVSNSMETDPKAFQREEDLLLSQDREAHIVYFGSLSIFYSQKPYAKHKKRMEEIVKTFRRYTIVRLGNISWGKNPHTIINFLKARISKGEPFEIQNVHRYILGIDEFQHWMNMIPDFSCEMNLPGEFLKVEEIVRRIRAGLL